MKSGKSPSEWAQTLKGSFEKGQEHFFRWLGAVIGRSPFIILFLSFLVTGLLSSGLFYFEETSNVREAYSPQDSPSRKEYEVSRKFLNQNGTLDPSYIMIEARDHDNLLKPEYRERLQELVKVLQNNVSIEYHGAEWFYRDLCEPYCELNTALLAFLRLYDPSNPSTYTYPNIEIFGSQAFIGNNVYNLKLSDSGLIESFSTAILPFYLVSHHEDEKVIYNWLIEARKAFEQPQFAIFECGITGDLLISAEVRRMGLETAPLIVGSVAAMIAFVVASSFRRDPSRSKPWESLCGCLIPLLSLLAAAGIMCFFEMKFQSIMVASLFLVLSVGVDDVFIILRAWDRTSIDDPIPDRMAITLEEAGASITISSITNVMAFVIGMTSSTPAVKAFSLFSAVSITVCYFYILIMFSAVLAWSGRREKSGKQAVLCCLKANRQARSQLVEEVVAIQVRVIRWWAKTCLTWTCRIVLLILMALYYYLSAVGIQRVETLISLEKMTLPDSYVQNFQKHFEDAMRSMQPISVFVKNPGDLRDPKRLETVKKIVDEFETTVNSYGPNSTFFWIRQYEDFLEYYVDSDDEEGNVKPKFTYTEIPTFFQSATYFYLETFVKFNSTACDDDLPDCISEFFFMTNFAGVIKYHELIPAVKAWRAIAEKYPDFGVFPFSDHSPFVDQTMVIDSTVWSSVGASLLCTALACVLFIPSLFCVICACCSVLSITVGIVGILTLWGIQLDPLSMAALLMAIGFSVDYTAHMCYHYYKAKPLNAVDKVEEALTTIGWPLMQVGLSTLVALAPLVFKQSYLAIVFLKTITVVVVLGMWHGLVVLPVILAALTKKNDAPTPSSSDSSERSSQRSHERKESIYRTQALINRLHKEFGKGAKVGSINEPPALSPEKACEKPAFTHRIALGRTKSLEIIDQAVAQQPLPTISRNF
ncbi:unnamed protein product, partial [Mesorhabditis belari]|uniref:SSD domain-containing protein n=1 Tax=Mesorhabditis belari TaxID=2138241 RepID=A0AAF3F4H3_9BILA